MKLSTLSVPTAIVLAVFIAGYVALIALGKPVPAWMAGAGGIVGSIILAAFRALFDASNASGQSSGSSTSSSSSSGPTPPAAARRYLAFGTPRRSGVYPAARSLLLVPVLALCGCVGGVPTPQTVQGVDVGLNAAICVIGTYTADVTSGKSEGDAIADCVLKCGVSASQASGVLDAHRKAETLEKAGKIPQARNDRERAVRARAILRHDWVWAS